MKIVDNPFFVLGVAPEASRIEIEREAQKLLGMLELDLAAAKVYACPLGPQVRTRDRAGSANRSAYRCLCGSRARPR